MCVCRVEAAVAAANARHSQQRQLEMDAVEAQHRAAIAASSEEVGLCDCVAAAPDIV